MKILASAFAALMFVSGGAWAETVYDCSLNVGGRGGWVGERAIFFIDQGSGQALVLDALANHLKGEPVPAKLDVRSNGNYVLQWEFPKAPAANNQTVRVIYTAIMQPGQGRVRIDAALPTADNTSSARGKCKVLKR